MGENRKQSISPTLIYNERAKCRGSGIQLLHSVSCHVHRHVQNMNIVVYAAYILHATGNEPTLSRDTQVLTNQMRGTEKVGNSDFKCD